MIVYRRLFSSTEVLNTNQGLGFIRGRKYDTDFDRLGRLKTQRELHTGVGEIGKEMRALNKELNLGRLGKWKKDMN